MDKTTIPRGGVCPECGAKLSSKFGMGRGVELCPACALRGSLAQGEFPSQESASNSPGAGRAGGRFGSYELVEERARGGMGVVWKARQVGLNRWVAIKVILAGRFATDESIRRFRVEAEAVARLRHWNIVAIHEAVEEDGQCFLSMEYVDGPTLAE